jgi:hypothetical protein
VEGLGAFAVARLVIRIAPLRPLPSDQPCHFPWTQHAVRYAA